MPAWSPDGSRLAFSVGGEPTRVFVFDRKALEVRRVAYGFWPTWSSDGSQIGYTRGLFAGVVSVNGVSDEPVLGVSGFSEPPQWSPVDGTYVYCFKHGFRESIFRGPPSTFGPLVGAGCDPSWSPDGRLIVFDRPSVDGGSSRIYLMNADGTNVRPLIR